MLPLRRSAVSSTRRLLRQSPRRFESSHGHGDAHAHAHPAGPTSESFSRGFYITIAAIPLSLAVYKFTYSDDSKPYLQQMIEKYSDFKDEWNRRNALHTVMIEQAAHDRNLFQSEKVSTEVDLRFPEMFNMGSPYNVIAGQGGADLTELVAHYEKENQKRAAKTQQRIQEREQEESSR